MRDGAAGQGSEIRISLRPFYVDATLAVPPGANAVVLLARADAARGFPAVRGGLADELRGAGLAVGEVDLVTLTSASAVSGFVDAVGADAARGASAASIGPITSEAARAAGLDVAIEAEESTMDGLVDAIVARYARG